MIGAKPVERADKPESANEVERATEPDSANMAERAESVESTGMVERVAYEVGAGVLIPRDHEALEQFAKLQRGSTVDLELFQRRSRVFSNSLHLLFKRIATSRNIRVRNVRGWLAIATGRADWVRLQGRAVPVPWGTNPGDMSAAELEAFWLDARDVIVDEILPMLSPYDKAEVLLLIENVDRHGAEDERTA